MENSELEQLKQLQTFLAGRQTEIHRERAFLDAEERLILAKRQEIHEQIGKLVIARPELLET